MSTATSQRPVGVTIVSIVVFISSLLTMGIMGYAMANFGLQVIFVIIFASALLNFFLSLGLLRGNHKARLVYTVVAVFTAVTNLALAPQITGQVLGNVLLSLVVLVVLYMPKSEAYFTQVSKQTSVEQEENA